MLEIPGQAAALPRKVAAMLDDPRQIAREAIPDVAAAVRSRSSSVAGVLGFFMVVMTIAIIASAWDPPKPGSHDHGIATPIIGTAMILAALGWPFMRQLQRGACAKRIAALALDPNVTWHLNDKLLVAADANGVPRIGCSIRLTSHLRNVLTTVPVAKVVSTPPRAEA